MILTVTIDCGSSALADDEVIASVLPIADEVELILAKIPTGMRQGSYTGPLLDSNGNRRGGWTLS